MANTRINYEGLQAFLNRAPQRFGNPPEEPRNEPQAKTIPPGEFPKRWTYASTCEEIVFSEDGLQIKSNGRRMIGAVYADKPLPADGRRFYYEVTLTRLGSEEAETEEGYIMLPDNKPSAAVGIGFNTCGRPPSALFPGWLTKSWGYHSDDGGFFENTNIGKKDPGRCCEQGDTMGCGVDLDAGRIWFTKNGERVGDEFEDVEGPIYPMLGWKDGVHMTTNFGATAFVCKEENFGINLNTSAA